MANVEPVRLGTDSQFSFKCHPGIECFTQCCRDINIILTPYDIIRLKNKLGLSSEEFLAIYTEPQMLEKTGLPVITLKFLDETKKMRPAKRVLSSEKTAASFTMIGPPPAAITPWVLLRSVTKRMRIVMNFIFLYMSRTAWDLKKISSGRSKNGAKIRESTFTMKSMRSGPI